MRNKAHEESIFWLCLGAFFMLISALLIVVLTAQYFRASELRRFGAKTDGTIKSIKSKIASRKRSTTDVCIRYTVEGKEYRNTISYYAPSMRVGDKINVYYDPQNPSKVSGGSETAFIVLGIGLMLLELSVGFLAFRAGLRGLRRKT